jgi:hypothetical protein
MIRQDELFIQVLGGDSSAAPRQATPGKTMLAPQPAPR